jgi:predicted nucleotidyltransferase
MRIQNDFKEFLRLLKAHDVDFVILGGYAVAFHGYVRNTQDLDILFRANDRGVRGLLAALGDFGFGEGAVTAAEIARPGSVIRMGVPPVRIELLNRVNGVTFDEVWAGRVAGHYDDMPVAYIGLAELLRNKAAAGRAKDLADIEELSRQPGLSGRRRRKP